MNRELIPFREVPTLAARCGREGPRVAVVIPSII
jgi:hypothetical protein